MAWMHSPHTLTSPANFIGEMRFAREVSDRCLFIADGNVLEDAPPEQFFDNPSHPRLKEFLSKVL